MVIVIFSSTIVPTSSVIPPQNNPSSLEQAGSINGTGQSISYSFGISTKPKPTVFVDQGSRKEDPAFNSSALTHVRSNSIPSSVQPSFEAKSFRDAVKTPSFIHASSIATQPNASARLIISAKEGNFGSSESSSSTGSLSPGPQRRMTPSGCESSLSIGELLLMMQENKNFMKVDDIQGYPHLRYDCFTKRCNKFCLRRLDCLQSLGIQKKHNLTVGQPMAFVCSDDGRISLRHLPISKREFCGCIFPTTAKNTKRAHRACPGSRLCDALDKQYLTHSAFAVNALLVNLMLMIIVSRMEGPPVFIANARLMSQACVFGLCAFGFFEILGHNASLVACTLSYITPFYNLNFWLFLLASCVFIRRPNFPPNQWISTFGYLSIVSVAAAIFSLLVVNFNYSPCGPVEETIISKSSITLYSLFVSVILLCSMYDVCKNPQRVPNNPSAIDMGNGYYQSKDGNQPICNTRQWNEGKGYETEQGMAIKWSETEPRTKMEKSESGGKATSERSESEGKATMERSESVGKATVERLESEGHATMERSESEVKATKERSESEVKATKERSESEVKATVERLESEGKATVERLESEGHATMERSESEVKATKERSESEVKATKERSESEENATVGRSELEGKTKVGRSKSEGRATMERSESEVKATKERSESEGKATKERSESEVKATKERSESEVKATKERSESEVKATKERSESEGKATKERSESEVKATKERSESEVKATKERSESEVKATKERSESEENATVGRSELEGKTKVGRSKSEGRATMERSESEVKATKERSESEVKATKERSESEGKATKERSESEVKATKERSESEVKATKERSESKVKATKERSESEVKAAVEKSECEGKVTTIERPESEEMSTSEAINKDHQLTASFYFWHLVIFICCWFPFIFVRITLLYGDNTTKIEAMLRTEQFSCILYFLAPFLGLLLNYCQAMSEESSKIRGEDYDYANKILWDIV